MVGKRNVNRAELEIADIMPDDLVQRVELDDTGLHRRHSSRVAQINDQNRPVKGSAATIQQSIMAAIVVMMRR